MKTESYPANRFQAFLHCTDGTHDQIVVASGLTHEQARDTETFPLGTIERNGRKWIYSYSLMPQYNRF